MPSRRELLALTAGAATAGLAAPAPAHATGPTGWVATWAAVPTTVPPGEPTVLADRTRWKDLLKSADRQKSGKINDKEHSIESLTRRLVAHERHHLFTPR